VETAGPPGSTAMLSTQRQRCRRSRRLNDQRTVDPGLAQLEETST
jgi:hypothetical protein